ncbi:MAG: hypothetical protein PVH63_12620 [Balneolaceae bacterium]|jgi:hypothetical protein
MKYGFLILITLLASCKTKPAVTPTEIDTFEQLAQSYQTTYMDGSENCEEILAAMDENIKMSENGKTWTYPDLKKFCPHLPKKNVVETYNDQRLLNSDWGYDFVSQLYVTSKKDTIRETVSRIWEKKNNTWKIVQMNNLLKKEVN